MNRDVGSGPIPGLPVDVELFFRSGRSVETHNVSGFQALLLHEPAPPLGQHVALAAIPVRVPEPPYFPVGVLEVQEDSFGGDGAVLEREVLLRLLLGDHEPVQLAHVARSHGFLEEPLPGLSRSIGFRFPGAHIVIVVNVEGPAALFQLVGVSVFAEHIHDLRLGVGAQKHGLVVVSVCGCFRQRLEIGNGVTAAEALGGDVVHPSGFLLLVERPKPHPLVFLVDLSPHRPFG
nr:ap2 erf and b3 domain-containing transcription factor rav1-like protein [Ipomoea trifida]